MRNTIRPSTLLALAFFTIAFASNAHADTTLLRTKLSIAGCGQPATLVLSRVSSKYDADPGEFNRITIQIGTQTFQFHTETPQIRLKPSVLNPPEDYTKLKSVSVDASGYFLRGNYYFGSAERPLLLFFGWPYASDPGSLLVLGFGSDCSPYQILQSENFELTALQRDPTGFITLIGKHSLSQVMAGADGAWLNGKPYATTYDPYSVYRIDPVAGSAKFSLEDSRLYNQTHYCWAGPQMSEAKAVVYNRAKKNEIECMSANRARDLIP